MIRLWMIAGLLGFLGGWFVAWQFNGWQADRREAQVQERCIDNQKITSEANNEYTNQTNNADSDAANLSGVLNAQAVLIASEANQHNAGSAKAIDDYQHEIEAKALAQYAREAEQLRIRLLSCQKFVDDVWSANDQ